jgi:hypothetical protein
MVDYNMERFCGLCNRQISLNDNLSGLVFDDEYFLCEDCCNKNTQNDIKDWTESTMQKHSEGMPVALWIIHEQNKGKTLMSSKK